MKVRKFTARTSRDALRQIREDMGPDAAILSNRMIKNGVEIIAVAQKELPRAKEREVPVRPLEMTEADVVGALDRTALKAARVEQVAIHAPSAAQDQRIDRLAADIEALNHRIQGVGLVEGSPDPSWMAPLLDEVRLLKDMMGSFTALEATRQPKDKAQVLDRLCAAGYSQAWGMKLLARVPREVKADAVLRFAKSALVQKLPINQRPHPIIDEGGVFALVGPTGVGKTTTLAKLAARFVVRHGADQLALISTDGYRIGGQEQLKIYGKLLGVAVYSVRDGEDLARTLKELSNRKLVLIDTVGRSQRDVQLLEQKKLFAGVGATVRRVLLLNTTCHGDTLEDVVEAYGGPDIAGVILSKLDESLTMGGAIEVAIRRGLRVLYGTHGQRVPEDLLTIDAKDLIERSLNQAPKRAYFSGWGPILSSDAVTEGRVYG